MLGRALLDLLEHQQLGAVQVADARDVGKAPLRGLVDGREVVEVQNVGVAGAGELELLLPYVH